MTKGMMGEDMFVAMGRCKDELECVERNSKSQTGMSGEFGRDTRRVRENGKHLERCEISWEMGRAR